MLEFLFYFIIAFFVFWVVSCWIVEKLFFFVIDFVRWLKNLNNS